jgi:ATP-binding cassette subfamily B protein
MVPLIIIYGITFLMIPLLTQQINMDLTKTATDVVESTGTTFITSY